MSANKTDLGATRGLPAHDVELQMSVIGVLVASGDKVLEASRGVKHRLSRSWMEGGWVHRRDVWEISGVALSRLRQYRGSDPYPRLACRLKRRLVAAV